MNDAGQRPRPSSDPIEKLLYWASPPGKVRIRRRAGVIPGGRFLGELEKLNMTVTKQHIEAVLAPGVVPCAPGIIFVAIRPPGPITGEKFVHRASRHVARLHRPRRGI